MVAPETLQPQDNIPVQQGASEQSPNFELITPEPFELKTNQQLLVEVIAAATNYGYAPEQVSYKQQPDFTHCTHAIINKYYMARRNDEWEREIDQPIAPPLPYQWVSSRIDTYYNSVFKDSADKTHQGVIRALRKEHLPTALKYAQSLPEIATAIDIQAQLDDAGYDLAADAVSDLLVVYGITLYYLGEKQKAEAKLKQEIAARAVEHQVKLIQ
ncbi:MAG: hypothetical protein QFB87_03505 [Patescibacteria group bacterium]|nr:hypothetical protein [Patescibacteria group bacterium]